MRATWRVFRQVAARVGALDDWNNIFENNEDKRVGVRVDVAANCATTVLWHGYAGNEQGATLRLFRRVGVVSRK